MDQNIHRERKNFEVCTLANLTCCLCEDDAVFSNTRWKISVLLFKYGIKDSHLERKTNPIHLNKEMCEYMVREYSV